MEKPVQLERLVMMPGERADIVVDFAQLMAEDAARNGIADGQYYLRNFGPDGPFTGFDDNTAAIAALNGFQDASFAINDEGLPDVADPNSTGQVMRFDVDASAPKPDSDFDPNRTLNTTLTDIFNNELNENNADYTRRLGLFVE